MGTFSAASEYPSADLAGFPAPSTIASRRSSTSTNHQHFASATAVVAGTIQLATALLAAALPACWV